jgi:hypothetical protein
VPSAPTLSARLRDSNRTVVVENQFGLSDNRHLGALQTYGSGMEAKIVIWVAEEFRNEHVKVLQDLNRRSDGLKVYAVRARLLRIDKSPPALMFDSVVPSDWELASGTSCPNASASAIPEILARIRPTTQG